MALKKSADSFSKSLVEEVQKWGGMKQTGVNLRYMMDFGKNPTQRNLLVSSQFLHRELAVRIARRVIDLECLPFGLSSKPAVLKVSYKKKNSFFLSLCMLDYVGSRDPFLFLTQRILDHFYFVLFVIILFGGDGIEKSGNGCWFG